MDRIGIDSLSVLGLPPVEFVNLAADLGCSHISTGPQGIGVNVENHPEWSLRDKATRQDMVSVMRDRNISISLFEALAIMPGTNVQDMVPMLELMNEVGARRSCTISVDPDRERTFDQFAALAELADGYGIELVVEFIPHEDFTIATLPDAVAAFHHVGLPNFKILMDTMHIVRSGSSAADVAALDPGMFGRIQLCDAPIVPKQSDYLEEAMNARYAPGDGELPLGELLAVLPRDLPIGLEIPLRARAEAGEGPAERLGPCVEAARRLLAQFHEEA